MSKLIYPQLSYKVIGSLFDAYKSLGGSFHERYCQRAVAKFLSKRKLSYKKEKTIDLKVEKEIIGKHQVDFIVEDKIVLEIKKGSRTSISDIKQVLSYLRSTGKKLGILAYFTSNGIIYKRIINNEK